jgi:hypothetical protein
MSPPRAAGPSLCQPVTVAHDPDVEGHQPPAVAEVADVGCGRGTVSKGGRQERFSKGG